MTINSDNDFLTFLSELTGKHKEPKSGDLERYVDTFLSTKTDHTFAGKSIVTYINESTPALKLKPILVKLKGQIEEFASTFSANKRLSNWGKIKLKFNLIFRQGTMKKAIRQTVAQFKKVEAVVIKDKEAVREFELAQSKEKARQRQLSEDLEIQTESEISTSRIKERIKNKDQKLTKIDGAIDTMSYRISKEERLISDSEKNKARFNNLKEQLPERLEAFNELFTSASVGRTYRFTQKEYNMMKVIGGMIIKDCRDLVPIPESLKNGVDTLSTLVNSPTETIGDKVVIQKDKKHHSRRNLSNFERKLQQVGDHLSKALEEIAKPASTSQLDPLNKAKQNLITLKKRYAEVIDHLDKSMILKSPVQPEVVMKTNDDFLTILSDVKNDPILAQNPENLRQCEYIETKWRMYKKRNLPLPLTMIERELGRLIEISSSYVNTKF